MQSIDRQFDDNGDPLASNTFSLTDSDMTEWAKMTRFTPAPTPEAQGSPWWQNLISYGVSKAIDNSFPNETSRVQGNTKPGSFAGQNGRTYNQVGGMNAAPTVAGLFSQVQNMSPLTLGALAIGAYFLLRR